MSWLEIHSAGRFGIITDVQPQLLPPAAWNGSETQNVQFINGKSAAMRGQRQVYPQVTRAVHWGVNLAVDIKSYWIYSDLKDLFVVSDDVAEVNISRTSGGEYSINLNSLWNGGNLSGILILNTGADIPQQFKPEVDSRARDLLNWPSALRCKVIKPFGYFLVAMNLKDGTNPRNVNRVRWSHPAIPGAVPASWDIDDAAVDAGEFDLPDEVNGEIVDGVELRDQFLIYERNSIWGMRFVGGNNIFAFVNLFPTIGALSEKCVAPFEYKGGLYHCVFTGDTIIAHNGQTVSETLDGKVTETVKRELDETNWRRSYVVNIPRDNENWICYPTANSENPNKAVVWNYKDNTVSFRDLGEINWIALGTVDDRINAGSWDNLEGSWNDQTNAWGASTEQQHNLRPVGFNPVAASSSIVQVSETYSNEGNPITVKLVRTHLAVLPNRQTQEAIVDFQSMKLFKKLRFQFGPETLPNDFEATVTVTTYNVVAGKLGTGTATGTATGTVSALDPEFHFMLNGKQFKIEIEISSTTYWELEGYSVDIEKCGEN